jgi:hypothetical protein
MILNLSKNKRNYLKLHIIKKYTELMNNFKHQLIKLLINLNPNLYNNPNKLLNPRLYHYKIKLNKFVNNYVKIT